MALGAVGVPGSARLCSIVQDFALIFPIWAGCVGLIKNLAGIKDGMNTKVWSGLDFVCYHEVKHAVTTLFIGLR